MLLGGEQMCVMTCRGRPGHRGGGNVEGRERWVSVGSTKGTCSGMPSAFTKAHCGRVCSEANGNVSVL